MRVITNHPVAVGSLDHLYPEGTMRDNTSSLPFIMEVEKLFGRPISYLDLGCAGGQMAVDFHFRGHRAVGLEGSDYGIVHGRPNWVRYHNEVLFTCDLTRPYDIVNEDGDPIVFDLISGWELFEHIETDDLHSFLCQIKNKMALTGLLVGTISSLDILSGYGVYHHRTVKSRQWWLDVLSDYFKVVPYPFKAEVRKEVSEGTSFLIGATR